MQFSLMTQSAFTTSWTTWICNEVDSNQDVVRFYIVVLKRTRVWFYLLYFIMKYCIDKPNLVLKNIKLGYYSFLYNVPVIHKHIYLAYMIDDKEFCECRYPESVLQVIEKWWQHKGVPSHHVLSINSVMKLPL